MSKTTASNSKIRWKIYGALHIQKRKLSLSSKQSIDVHLKSPTGITIASRLSHPTRSGELGDKEGSGVADFRVERENSNGRSAWPTAELALCESERRGNPLVQ